MPRKTKAPAKVGDLFTVEAGSAEGHVAAGFAGSKNGPINGGLAEKVRITVGMNPETVVQLDKQGKFLLFEQKEQFIQLPDAVVSGLNRDNRLRYEMAKDFHDAWRGDEHAELVEAFQVNKQLSGSASDRLQKEDPEGMVTRWARPGNIERYRAMGYKVLDADEVKTYLGPTGTHHEVGSLGQTELVLMGIPKPLFDKRMAAKTQRNNELAGSWRSVDRNSGAGEFVAEDDDRKHGWSEIKGLSEQ